MVHNGKPIQRITFDIEVKAIPEVRDFIYLDQSRVLSIGSQLLGGIADRIVDIQSEGGSSSKELELAGEFGATMGLGEGTSRFLGTLISSLVKPALNADVGIGHRLARSRSNESEVSETKILNHYQFSLLINSLRENKLLKNLDTAKPHEWKPRGTVHKNLKPGDFIEVECKVEFVDVSHVVSVVRALEKFMEMMNGIVAAQKINEMITEEKVSPDQALQEITSNPMQFGYDCAQRFLGPSTNLLEMNTMIDFMKSLADGEVASVPMHMIARPVNASRRDIAFVSPLREGFLFDSREELIFKYGFSPDQRWRILGQVCKIPKEDRSDLSELELPKIDEEKIDRIVKELTSFFVLLSTQLGIHSSVSFPDISLNLLAIYRQ